MSRTGSPRQKVTFAVPAGRDIPSRRIAINDISQLPDLYSTTPGGTWFSTTPGGTRIIYDRNFLMQMRNSPMAQSSPKNLPSIPGVTRDSPPPQSGKENKPFSYAAAAIAATTNGVAGASINTTTLPGADKSATATAGRNSTGNPESGASAGDDPQFQMDM